MTVLPAGSNENIFRLYLPLVPLLAVAAIAFFAPLIANSFTREAAFAGTSVMMIVEFSALGVCIGGKPAAVIIDSRNCMSLSKLQACAWTVLILSAVLVAAAFNLSLGAPNPLSIKIPGDLVVAMGISATSLAVTPALLSLKAGQTPSPGALATASKQLTSPGGDSATMPNIGTLMANSSADDAKWTDMLTGDEVGNFASPDIGKIQQVLVTILLVGVYATQVAKSFSGRGVTSALPEIDPSFIWLLGVSHAGYLAYKAAPHTSLA